MKKRVIAVLTAVLMTASLAGCGSGKLSNDYVTVNKYKGLEVTEVAKNEVSDDSVEQEVQSRLEAAATEQDVTDRAAQSGDWVNIDYTGTLDGVAFDGGTATGYDLELGSGSFIGASGDYQGFEDQIVGHNTGEEFDITVQFPENYQSSDLAGKPANFHIVLNKIYQKVTPELTDEWVANNSESSKTVDEYKEEVKNSLQEQQDDSGNSQLKQEVQTALLDQIEVNKYPDGAVDEQVKQANDYYTQIAQMYGVELSDFITTYLKMTEDQFNEKIEDSAKQAVQLEEAVKLIAKKEKLEPSDKEYKEGMQEYADKAGADLDTYKEQVGEDVLKDAILRDKVLDYLVDNCVQVEQSDKN
ncbi:trigger factor [Mediterraneibacter faecis]|uniref:trigger factor n=1 Tax=Mediterraneibacter faecis TaxID=592978 RepID=UPI0018ABA011|nr:trigger factor [Mediterraneibacter faecis]